MILRVLVVLLTAANCIVAGAVVAPATHATAAEEVEPRDKVVHVVFATHLDVGFTGVQVSVHVMPSAVCILALKHGLAAAPPPHAACQAR